MRRSRGVLSFGPGFFLGVFHDGEDGGSQEFPLVPVEIDVAVEGVAHSVCSVQAGRHEVCAGAEQIAVCILEDDVDPVEQALDGDGIGREGEAGAGVYDGGLGKSLTPGLEAGSREASDEVGS